ncbi:hypothetical protein [Saccharococcus caldoxylosilyticus]|uniref:hypothetical protein n=1 Tax=Saccharococcus caldoxylosilyticus TaxID=81408 RepID=UPI0012FE1C41|nr:hypothetical protein [Parageobacillus caldoxylosilyticus]
MTTTKVPLSCNLLMIPDEGQPNVKLTTGPFSSYKTVTGVSKQTRRHEMYRRAQKKLVPKRF